MVTLAQVVPILRSFDEAKAREFYVGFLGFDVDFEHRFGDNSPLYMGLRRSGCRLHLSEHHGDATPGAHVRIETVGLAAYAVALAAKDFKYAKPGAPRETPWGTMELTVTDPFGNRLTFVEATPNSNSK
jgi:uncharacterized glyoxalase superfamily protein PhnB